MSRELQGCRVPVAWLKQAITVSALLSVCRAFVLSGLLCDVLHPNFSPKRTADRVLR
jgi:hypothetical protein